METISRRHSTFLLDAPLISREDANIYSSFLEEKLSQEDPNLADLLSSIPCHKSSSYGPLATLSAVLSALPGPWPILQLQQTYSKAWKQVPEEAKSGNGCFDARQLLNRVLLQCKQSYSSLLDMFHASQDAAIIDPQTGHSLDHDQLTAFVNNFDLPVLSSSGQAKPVIAISLPNGPLLALTVLAIATYYTAAPLAHGSGVCAEQFKSDVLQSHADVVLASASDVSRLGLHDPWLSDAGLTVLLVDITEDMSLLIRHLNGDLVPASRNSARTIPNHAEDISILLFTSGTSGTKKLVPLNIHSMICGVAMVIDSWGLSSSMRCLNQMPLNHVGGLVRNLFAPVLSGGSVICCSAFDANLFWDCVEDYAPTWYYASPTMHQCILGAGADRPEAVAKSQIKLVCNAAGGLLPSFACQLRDIFSCNELECVVLPSYGMTECMPISTPPLDYRLEKPGTSGISIGPEISILDGKNIPVENGLVGRISVRGHPVFGGYVKANGVIDRSCFTEHGWFDTGDMGYLDDEGYLFITGRSKEVINRGGELISPFEVEEAIVAASSDPTSLIYGRVSKALAFPVGHDVLQEVVGILVTKPDGAKRACLRGIQESVKCSLAHVKIPVLLVHMDDGLPMNNNKVVRIKLADRLGLPEISDNTSPALRYYKAECPPPNTPLSKHIECVRLEASHDSLQMACERLIPKVFAFHIRPDSSNFYPELFLAPIAGTPCKPTLEILKSDSLVQKLANVLDSHIVPYTVHRLESPLPRKSCGSVDDDAIDILLRVTIGKGLSSSQPSTEAIVAGIFADILSVSTNDLSSDSDFFDLGGDSMKAGRLLSLLRRKFKLRLPIDILFINSQISNLASLIDEKIKGTVVGVETTVSGSGTAEPLLPGCEQTCSSTNPWLLSLQLIPLTVLYPMKRTLTWTIFMYCIAYTQRLVSFETIPGRLFNLVVSMGVARIATRIICPCLGILLKWLIMGKYKEGLYPMWGFYHTRWWICQKVISICGTGVFSTTNWSRVLYYQCLGARIGKYVSLQRGVTIGEYDLLTIEDGATLERCTARPFAVERNTSLYLGRITIGEKSSIGLASIIAPGTHVPPNTCIGPNSSSWEVDGADEGNRDLGSGMISGAHWVLTLVLGLPIQLITIFIRALPWLGCLVALVNQEPQGAASDELRLIITWFASPERVGYHYLALAANASLGPAFLFAIVLLFKKVFDGVYGKVVAGKATQFSQMTKFRKELMKTLMPAPRLHELTELFGSHYEPTSILMRAMGSKIGKQVYWPGTGPSIQDFDLLEVGDSVVFGSRSHLVTSDGTGTDYVRIGSGAMVADRVVLLPGVELGDRTVLGSGALTKRGARYPNDSTWVGSKNGEAICLTATSPTREKSTAPDLNSSIDNSNSVPVRKHVRFDDSLGSFNVNKSDNIFWQHINVLKTVRHAKDVGTSVTVFEVAEDAVINSGATSSTPFGRAYYEGLAPYRVWSQFEIFLYSTFITVATTVFWNLGSVSAVQIVARMFEDNYASSKAFLAPSWFRPIAIYFLFLALTIPIMAVQSIAVIIFTIAAKWILVGNRSQGNYDWDKSSYCQRWQLFLKLESFRRHCYGGHGILGMLTGTYWMALYFRALGAKIGKDCALFAGGLPSLLLTEPDLLTLGDRVSMDDASLVAHINTRGKFDLNPLHVGDRSVLRSGSRLLSGARMEADTCLLEHTLIMAGDVVDAGSTCQGWPAEEFKGSRMPTLKIKQVWAKAEESN